VAGFEGLAARMGARFVSEDELSAEIDEF